MITGKLYMAIDVGTTKVCTLLAQVASNGQLEIVGTGVEPSRGMHKGMVVQIDDMEQAISASVEQASQYIDNDLPGACVGVTGGHISSLHTTGTLDNINGDERRVITRKEIDLVLKQSQPKLAPGQVLLHVIPKSYEVDSLHGVRSPAGLKGHALTVESNAIVGEATALDNVVRAVERSGIAVKSMVLEPLASAEAVLSAEEKEGGVILVDIGGGTSDIAVFKDGVMLHSAVIPVAGYQFTNDLAIALGIPYAAAEAAKLKYGHAIPDAVGPDEMAEIQGHDNEMPRLIRRRELCHILNDRGAELLRLILLKVREGGLELMPHTGVVFTGGGANLEGWTDLAKEVLHAPVRIASPKDILGLPEELTDPTYSTSVGILLWGIHHPTEQLAYHQKNGRGPSWKGRWWLRWLRQFTGS